MAERFTKPNPAIKKNVLKTRAAARNAKTAHASVVATSMLATLFAWALFSHQDAQITIAAKPDTANQAAISAPAQSDAASPNTAHPPVKLEITR